MRVCENCGKEIDKERFCNKSCAISLSNRNRIWTEKSKEKISIAHKGISKPGTSEKLTGRKRLDISERMKGNKNCWNGGSYGYWHEQAKKLFGKDLCQKCNGISKGRIKLVMHCTSEPKDYTIMEESNWMTLCISCHNIVDKNLYMFRRRNIRHSE